MYFGRYGFVEDTKEEKKLFLERLNYLIHSLEYNDKKEYNEKEIIDVTKIVLKKYVTDSYHNLYTDALSIFLTSMGLSYFILTPEEKKEILEMDYTYDNWYFQRIYGFVLKINISYFIFEYVIIKTLKLIILLFIISKATIVYFLSIVIKR